VYANIANISTHRVRQSNGHGTEQKESNLQIIRIHSLLQKTIARKCGVCVCVCVCVDR